MSRLNEHALRWLPMVWAVVLTLVILGPALAPGYVLIRDMVWLPDLYAGRADVAGLGEGLPRAVPSDMVVGLLDNVIAGEWLQKLILVAALVTAGLGAAALVGGGLVRQLTAVSLMVWNPFVIERLLIGHWPVLCGYAVVPWLVIAGQRIAVGKRVPIWLIPAIAFGSLSANAGLVSAAALLVPAMVGVVVRDRRWLAQIGVAITALVALNAPWLVAGLVRAEVATAAGGFDLFRPNGDGLPAPLSVLTFGGIWNSEVVPGSRDGVLVWLGLALLVGAALAGWSRAKSAVGPQFRPLVLLWVIAIAIAWVTWAVPGVVAALSEVVPGVGLLRDGARSLALVLPLTLVVVAAGVDRMMEWANVAQARRIAAAVAAVLIPIALLPDAAWGGRGQLKPVDYPVEYAEAAATIEPDSGLAVVLPLANFRAPSWNNYVPVIDPLGRYFETETLIDDTLVIGGEPVAGEDPLLAKIRSSLAAETALSRTRGLLGAGVRWVVVDVEAADRSNDPEAVPDLDSAVRHSGELLEVYELVGEPTVDAERGGTWAAVWSGWVAAAATLVVGLIRWAVAALRRRRRGKR